jgi:hypothetical protein
MARPPYSPVPEVSATDRATPYLSEPSTPAAFGGTIGGAEQQLGGEEKQAGSTLFQAAAQAQDFKNTNDARTANIGFMNAATDLYSKYSTLEGQQAMDALPKFQQQLEDTIKQHAATLGSPMAQSDFLNVARYSMSRMLMGAGTYAAQQQKQGWIKTNEATVGAETQFAIVNQNSPGMIVVGENKVRSAAEDNALHLGLQGDAAQQYIAGEVSKYYAPLLQAKMLTPGAQGGGAQNAMALFNSVKGKLDARTQDEMLRMLHPAVKDAEADSQLGTILQGLGSSQGNGGGGAAPQWKGGAVSADQMNSALWGQESGGKADAATSVTGATGGHQIQPATFAQYARPGEDIHNTADNAVVGARIVTDLTKRFDGDPARIAVGYFSGPGNVAPAGSATPWLEDKKDPTGKSTSSYVNDVLGRLGGTGTGGTTQVSAPGGEGQAAPSGWRMPDWSKAEQAALTATEGDPEGRTALLGKLAQTRQRIEMATKTERSDLSAKLGDLQKAAEAGVQISIPEDRIRAVFEPDDADRIMTKIGVSQAAGQIMSGLKFASPEQLGTTVADLTSGTGTVSDTLRARLGKDTSGSVTTPAANGQPALTEPAESFGLRTQIAAKAIQLIQARQEQLKQDPANYTLQEPTVNAAAKSLKNDDPTTFDNYARAQLAVQDHLGVRPEAQHILTLDQANTFTQQVMQPGGDAKATLDKFQKEWGNSWTHVFGDMVTMGKLPAAYQGVIALDDDPKNAAVLARAASEQVKSGKAWDDILGKQAGAGKPMGPMIRDQVNSSPAMQQLETSWRTSGATLAQVESMRSAVHTLAYGLSYYNQDATAADHAVAAFTDKYRFIPNGGARVPAEKYATVMSNAGQMLEGITPQGIAIPEGFRAEDTPEARRLGATMPTVHDYISDLQTNPQWITSQKGDGLNLLDHAGRPVRDAKGGLFFVPFNGPLLPGATQPQGQQSTAATYGGT